MLEIISMVRGEKTNNNVSLKTPIKNLTINLNPVFEGLNGKGNLMIQNSKSKIQNYLVCYH